MDLCELKVKWKQDILSLSLPGESSVKDLKVALQEQTGCRADRIKLYFRKGKVTEDDKISVVKGLQNKIPIRMMGTPESKIQEQAAKAVVSVGCSIGKEKVRAVYTHTDGRKELVDIIKKHDVSEGDCWTIFVPSLGRERQTLAERLDFTANELDDAKMT